MLVEVFAEEVAEESRDADHPAPMVSGEAEVELAPGLGNRLGNADAEPGEFTSPTSQGGGLSPTEPAVGEEVDEGAVRLSNRDGQPFHLIGVEEQHLWFGLSRIAHPVDGIRR